MKYVDERAWEALLGALKDGGLVSADKDLRAALINSLPGLPEMSTMPAADGGVDPTVVEEMLGDLANQVALLTTNLEDADQLELTLANLSYVYHLAGKAWDQAYGRVVEISGQPTVASRISQIAAGAFTGALKLAACALTLGLAPIVYTALSAPVADLTGQTLQQKDVHDGLGKALNTIAGAPSPFGSKKSAVDVLVNPSKMFAQYEGHVRELAVKMRQARADNNKVVELRGDSKMNLPSQKERETINAALQSLTSVGDFSVLVMSGDSESFDEKWQNIADILNVTMLRLAWSQYCRSCWNDMTWNFKLALKTDILTSPAVTSEPDPTKWPAKVWDSIRGLPNHWSTICADFQGPEHKPFHPIHKNVTAEQRQALQELAARMPWISMAAVHCCQIRRDIGGDKMFDMLDDSGEVQIGIGDALRATSYNDTQHSKYLVRGRRKFAIDSIVLSDKNVWFTPKGGKGTITHPNTPADTLRDAPGYDSGTIGVKVNRLAAGRTDSATVEWCIVPDLTPAEVATVSVRRGNDSKRSVELFLIRDGKEHVLDSKKDSASTTFVKSAQQSITFKAVVPGLYCITLAYEKGMADQFWFVYVPPKLAASTANKQAAAPPPTTAPAKTPAASPGTPNKTQAATQKATTVQRGVPVK